MGIDTNSWEAIAAERTAWRQTVQQGLCRYEETLAQQNEIKRQKRKACSQGDRPVSDYTCTQCGKQCLSGIGLASHT